MKAILDLYDICFKGRIGDGDYLFTPAMHGVRHTKSMLRYRFDTSGRFSDYFKSVALRRLGRELRPYAVRRLNAENLQRIDASEEVQNSHSALMGTGVQNLRGCYDQRTQLEKGFPASEVQRFQFSNCFAELKQTMIVPALIPGMNADASLQCI